MAELNPVHHFHPTPFSEVASECTDLRCVVNVNRFFTYQLQKAKFLLHNVMPVNEETIQHARELKQILTNDLAYDAQCYSVSEKEADQYDIALMKTAKKIAEAVKELERKFGIGEDRKFSKAAIVVTLAVGTAAAAGYLGYLSSLANAIQAGFSSFFSRALSNQAIESGVVVTGQKVKEMLPISRVASLTASILGVTTALGSLYVDYFNRSTNRPSQSK